MIIGDIGLRAVSMLLSGVPEKIERVINPHVLSREEYIRRKRTEDHFTSHVLKGPKLFIIGGYDEFEDLGR